MSAIRIVYAIARADFLERVRRYSYLVTLLFAVYLGYAAGTGKISLRLGDYRGLYTSAWIGAMVSLVATTFLSLVGFYIVKNAVDRDRQTRVGEILAGTPLTRITYLLGKFLSNFAVLVSMVAVLALAAVAMQFLAAEDRAFHVGALLLPFLFLTMPAVAITAAMALLFEAFRFLRGGVGNVLWFFLWTFGIALPGLTGHSQLDPSGLWTVFQSMVPAARAGIPGYVESFSLTVADKSVRVATGFHWNGVEWTFGVLGWRLAWTAVAFAVVLCSAWFFDRFDPARSRRKSRVKPRQEGASAQAGEAPEIKTARRHTATPTHLSPLPAGPRHSGSGRLLTAELRLALKGYRWWWYAVAGGLLIAQFAAPLEISRGPLLAFAWIWPILVWSALGTREARFGTEQLLFSCPRILPRQLPAAWVVGILVAALTGLGAAARLALAGQHAGLLAWAAGAMFVPSLALALGVWSGTSKFFEGLYTALWYVGPMNRVPGLDFTGSASGPQAARDAVLYLGIAAILLGAAFFRRARQLRGT
ncbi:MAG: hypothetical protein ABSF71_28265 [Terriglobia bacterium]|jgi:hypothetical protein